MHLFILFFYRLITTALKIAQHRIAEQHYACAAWISHGYCNVYICSSSRVGGAITRLDLRALLRSTSCSHTVCWRDVQLFGGIRSFITGM